MFYTIQNGSILKAETEQALTRYYDNVKPLPIDYEEGKYIVYGDELVLNPNYEAEREQQERERIQELSMTRGDLFEALILAQGVGKPQLRAMIENFEGITDLEKVLYLNRFDEALDFFRKHPAIDLVGGLLGITPEQMDKFFDTKDYRYLITPKKEEELPTEEFVDIEGNVNEEIK